MATFKSLRTAPKAPQTKKLVWRISDRAPQGEWVDPSATVEATVPLTALPEVSTGGGWLTSSFDLLNGMDVNESHDTVPGEYLDELLPPHAGDPKTPKL
jgi:hypothetical protein